MEGSVAEKPVGFPELAFLAVASTQTDFGMSYPSESFALRASKPVSRSIGWGFIFTSVTLAFEKDV